MTPPADPLSAREFAASMAACGPFEPSPLLAVAVSGGPDSMALVLLAASWARRRGGDAVALTVDHRLRLESAGEARRVGSWMRDRGIDHRTLRLTGEWPAGNRQAVARDARYDRLGAWCRRKGVLHLLVGHHLEDQAETVLARLARSSGVDGLAAMAPVVETDGVRVLRPLLTVSRDRLRATLARRGQVWIDDPSNADDSYLRPRLRRARPTLDGLGLNPERLAATADRLRAVRRRLERETLDGLAAWVEIAPAGYVRIDAAKLAAADRDLGRRVLARVVATVGGAAYPPRADRLAAALDALRDGPLSRARTVGGCRLIPANGRVLVCREAGRAESRVLDGANRIGWDGRFALGFGRAAARRTRGLTIGPLGRDGWAALVATDPDLRETRIPYAARLSLPAIRDRHGAVLHAPHFAGRVRAGRAALGADTLSEVAVMFRPLRPVGEARAAL